MPRESARKRGGAGLHAAQAQSYAAQGDAQRRKGAEAAPRCGELPYVVQTTLPAHRTRQRAPVLRRRPAGRGRRWAAVAALCMTQAERCALTPSHIANLDVRIRRPLRRHGGLKPHPRAHRYASRYRLGLEAKPVGSDRIPIGTCLYLHKPSRYRPEFGRIRLKTSRFLGSETPAHTGRIRWAAWQGSMPTHPERTMTCQRAAAS